MTFNEEKYGEIYDCIKMLSPGTMLREGLENILKAKTGALIVVSDKKEIIEVVKGGFNINCEMTPAQLYELAKMDGAIVLSSDAKKIIYANAQLTPLPEISSVETGIRHRIAEKVAKQTGELVISISQRRSIITLYKDNSKFVLNDVSKVLIKANQAIQTLEKYKATLNQSMNNLSALEFEDLVTVYDVTKVLQRTEMVMRIVFEIEKYIFELGNEGRLLNMQMEELTNGVLEDGMNVIKDYYKEEDISANNIKDKIRKLTSEELLDLSNIAKILGYTDGLRSLDETTSPKGYRILSKIPRLPSSVLTNVINEFKSLQKILTSSISELDEVDGIGEVRAKMIKDGLRRFQEQSIFDRHM
ncbi:DNA integrity scanning diadenylate cyclase DisA [Clostridiaceae bacterium M8S5]|nr:DNA integrity scanning diadenylate cyclase DisA [Clostridiaceae bacterium M8S5]